MSQTRYCLEHLRQFLGNASPSDTPEVRQWMSDGRVEAKAKYPLVGPEVQRMTMIMCMGVKAENVARDMGVMTPISRLVAYLRCQVSLMIRFCTSRNRNAIIGSPQCRPVLSFATALRVRKHTRRQM